MSDVFTSKKTTICAYINNRNQCPDNCASCSAYYSIEGGTASRNGNLIYAISCFKKALVIEPENKNAWIGLAKVYQMLSQGNNANDAYLNALIQDPWDANMVLLVVESLMESGKPEAAMQLLNINSDVLFDRRDEANKLKTKLISLGIRDTLNDLTQENAKTKLAEASDEIINNSSYSNMLLARGKKCSEEKRFGKESFVHSVIDYCVKRYSTLGQDTVYRKSILFSFYGAIFLVLADNGLEGIENNDFGNEKSSYEFLKDHVDLDRIEDEVERLLEIYSNDSESVPWKIINGYSQQAMELISRIQPQECAINSLPIACTSSFELGTCYAYREITNCNLKLNQTEIILTESQTQVVYASFHYSWSARANFSIKDNTVASCEWGYFLYGSQRDSYYEEHGDNHVDWDLVPLYIRGKKEGTSSLTISIRDSETKETVEEKTIPVKVLKGNSPSIQAVPALVQVKRFETQTVGIHYMLSSPKIVCTVDDLSIANASIKEPISENIAFINICGRDEGITFATVRFLTSENDAVVASTDIIIVVGEERLTTPAGEGFSFYNDSALRVDSRVIRLARNTSRTVTCTYSYEEAITVRYQVEFGSIVSCKWGPFSGKTCPITITGKNQGTSKIMLYLLGQGGRLLCALDMEVIVT